LDLKNDNGEWSIKYSDGLYTLYKDSDGLYTLYKDSDGLYTLYKDSDGLYTLYKDSDGLYTLYKDSDIITYIKINHLRWAGHVIRLEEQNPARRVFAAVVEARRQKGRPKLRWEDGVMGDAKKLGERRRSTARNRDGWQELLGKAFAQVGLMCQ
jgi:uncharacterized protein YegP (UPF0339 family)